MKNCSLWEGPTLEDCLPWEGPHTGAGEECEKEGAAERMCNELIMTPVDPSLSHSYLVPGQQQEPTLSLLTAQERASDAKG